MRPLVLVALSLLSLSAWAQPPPCDSGSVFEDRNGNARRDHGEPGVLGVRVSDGVEIVTSDAQGRYTLPAVDGRTAFVIKPPGYTLPVRANGMPDYWHNLRTAPGPALKYGGIPVAVPACRDFALRRATPSPNRQAALSVLLFADPQPKSMADVGYYERDIIASAMQEGAIDMGHGFGKFHFLGGAADLGLSLGDIVHDDLALYPALNAATAKLGVPWLHVAGNHDLDFDATRDEDSLLTFRHHYGPDTFAWEEPEATFIVLDDVVYLPGPSPDMIGGLREAQFAFLERYLPTVPKERLLVIGVHVPFFDTAPDRETFRKADRARLFALLRPFPHVLLLSGHAHTQRHVFHGAASGWHGANPLHEYNVGAASGAFWSGAKDAAGIPDARMSDGTPNGYARLRVEAGGRYRLSWHPARLDASDAARTAAMSLHAPKVLRRGAYPAFGVYANVYMGRDDSRVEFRVDEGPWQPMVRVERPDPGLLAENMRDDQAERLRGYDRSPEAGRSRHLWRGVLPTDLALGEHRIEVRAFDAWHGEQRARTRYRLDDAKE
ncbi:calcineurin-like phosphoesterase C-terminal domain-containing protein [Lysobacter koreensis]|uniref:Calcineurin-like phosphoesterase C-terminal domain-containing protein n=1 Tax=Lysobacter koreensis TaxID=266122 RepID=A0ABW2YP07_9GAMM